MIVNPLKISSNVDKNSLAKNFAFLCLFYAFAVAEARKTVQVKFFICFDEQTTYKLSEI